MSQTDCVGHRRLSRLPACEVKAGRVAEVPVTLTCDAAQKMGYRNVHSLIGGYKGMVAAGWPVKSGD